MMMMLLMMMVMMLKVSTRRMDMRGVGGPTQWTVRMGGGRQGCSRTGPTKSGPEAGNLWNWGNHDHLIIVVVIIV
eukprot:11985783-Karenia_brevis.AAC.1